MRSIYRRCLLRVKNRIQGTPHGQLNSLQHYLPYVQGKSGLEIGGPSAIFGEGNPLPIYEEMETLDNCDFSQSTEWATHTETFQFSLRKEPGKTLFCDGSALVDVPDSTYDVVLSSHNLEHFVTPSRH